MPPVSAPCEAGFEGLGAPSPTLVSVTARVLSQSHWGALVVAVVLAAAARVTYLMLLDAAVSFGAQVKAAFDLYLNKLPAQLGYKLPPTRNEQVEFWYALRRSYAYLEPAPPAVLQRAPPTGNLGEKRASEAAPKAPYDSGKGSPGATASGDQT